MKKDFGHKTFLSAVLISVIVIIVSTANVFLYKKEFNFFTEQECNPQVSNCNYRDCNIDGCPPNGFAYYKTYEISAKYLQSCTSEGCIYECASGMIECVEVVE